MPVFEILEQQGLEVYVVNAQPTKNVPGRKSDMQECPWLLKLHAFGLLNNSFPPNDEIRMARTRRPPSTAAGLETQGQTAQPERSRLRSPLRGLARLSQREAVR
jgi:hypothetical protein